jgi:gluconokinase
MTRPGTAIVVMGVSASGKSVVGIEIARRPHLPFVDADDLHPAENVAKMSQGIPLTGADRMPWLDLVGDRLALRSTGGEVPDSGAAAASGVVVACSALKRSYRDRLRARAPHTVFVHLTGDPELLSARALARTGHFMPPALLASQLATLEPLETDEPGVVVDVAEDVATVAERAVEWVQRESSD